MTSKYGRKTAKLVASDAGLSASYVRQLVATANTFPEDRRAKDLSFSHHRVAALTEEPERWLETAIKNELSVADLKEAISANKDRLSEAEEARRAAERLMQAVLKFNDRFSSITGQKAKIVWEDVLRESA